jgi:hypothetical protein
MDVSLPRRCDIFARLRLPPPIGSAQAATGSTVMSFFTEVTPGADQAALSASCRSAQDRHTPPQDHLTAVDLH